MFNGVRVSLEGKVASVKKLRADDLSARITRAEKQVAGLAEQSSWDQVHQKQRRLAKSTNRLVGLEADISADSTRLCFGSRRLWCKQHDLEANGYSSHEEWLRDWREAHSDEFFLLAAGMRRRGVSCASPVLPMLAQ